LEPVCHPANRSVAPVCWSVDKKNVAWLAAIVVLLAVIMAGTGSVWARHRADTAVAIRQVAPVPDAGQVYIAGAVAAPGWYPLREGDTFDGLIAAAGGLLPGADAARVSLTVGASAGNPQRIDINTAAAWLLAALPGIGETKAQAIVDYRQAHGLFRDTTEIMNVPGIGQGLYDDIRDLITVGE
jgi:competence protein ComEA